MEPQANNRPSPESLPPVTTPETGAVAPVEAPSAPEVERPKEAAGQGTSIPLPQVQSVPSSDDQPPPSDDGTAVGQPSVKGAPAVADDVDVIEKEWVDKAKAIVNETKEDPHKQNKEVSFLKADYMKKRYGKDIKLAKD